MLYRIRENKIVLGPDDEVVAVCADENAAGEAMMLLNQARHLNDVKRRYTESARKIYQAEQVNGFKWINP